MQHLISLLPALAIFFTNVACLCYLQYKQFKNKNYSAIIFGLIILLFFFPFNLINDNFFLAYCQYTVFLYLFVFYFKNTSLIALISYPVFMAALLSPFSWSKLYFQAIKTDNIFLHKVLGTSVPNFQDNPKLVLAIMLFFVFAYFIREIKLSWKIFNVVSLFLALLFSSYYPFFVILLAFNATFCLISNDQSSLYLKYKTILKYFLACILLITLSCVLIKQIKKSPVTNYDNLIISIEKDLSARILIDFDLKNNLSHNPPGLFPDLQKAIKKNGSPDISYLAQTSEFDDYYKIITLTTEWKELLEKNNINFALLHRDSSLAGVLIEVEKWKIVEATEPKKYVERGMEKFSPIVLLRK